MQCWSDADLTRYQRKAFFQQELCEGYQSQTHTEPLDLSCVVVADH